MTRERVDRVTEVLASNGYTQVDQPLKIGSLDFTFSSVLLGGIGRPELIVVVDAGASEELQRVSGQIEALARALDIVGSRRSLTIVLVGPATDDVTRDKLRRFGRVLHADHGLDAVVDDLAVLLPLSLAGALDAPDHSARLRQRLLGLPPYIEPLLDASRGNSTDVAHALIETLAEPFEPGNLT